MIKELKNKIVEVKNKIVYLACRNSPELQLEQIERRHSYLLDEIDVCRKCENTSKEQIKEMQKEIKKFEALAKKNSKKASKKKSQKEKEKLSELAFHYERETHAKKTEIETLQLWINEVNQKSESMSIEFNKLDQLRIILKGKISLSNANKFSKKAMKESANAAEKMSNFERLVKKKEEKVEKTAIPKYKKKLLKANLNQLTVDVQNELEQQLLEVNEIELKIIEKQNKLVEQIKSGDQRIKEWKERKRLARQQDNPELEEVCKIRSAKNSVEVDELKNTLVSHQEAMKELEEVKLEINSHLELVDEQTGILDNLK